MMEDMTLRPVTDVDTLALAQILDQMDPEDAELATEAMSHGTASVFSLAERGERVVGFVGVTPIEETQSSAWLSWSGFSPHADRFEIAQALTLLNEQSREAGLTRLIAMEADQVTGRRARQHEAYLAGLREAGFEQATHLPDFYEPGEGAVFWVNTLVAESPAQVIPEEGGVVFTGVFEHEESDGAYVLDWRFNDGPTDEASLHEMLVEAREEEEARMVVCSVPSTLVGFDRLMASAGLHPVGQLDSFYAPGVHEVQYLIRWQ